MRRLICALVVRIGQKQVFSWQGLNNKDAGLSDCTGSSASLSMASEPQHDKTNKVGWLCWGLTSQSTIFQSCRDGAIASWVINQYFRGVKCLAQGHNTAAVGFEPRTSRSGVRHSTTEPPRSPKPTKWLCTQRRLRSAWASAQSDLRLHYALNG